MSKRLAALDGQVSSFERISLRKPICAVKLSSPAMSNEVVGVLTKLATGTPVYVCGSGPNERTVEVVVNGQRYLVFRQDIGQ